MRRYKARLRQQDGQLEKLGFLMQREAELEKQVLVAEGAKVVQGSLMRVSETRTLSDGTERSDYMRSANCLREVRAGLPNQSHAIAAIGRGEGVCRGAAPLAQAREPGRARRGREQRPTRAAAPEQRVGEADDGGARGRGGRPARRRVDGLLPA